MHSLLSASLNFRYGNVDLYLGKLSCAINSEFQEKKAKESICLAMEDVMSPIRLYCDIVTLLEELYHWMIMVVSTG